MYLHISTQPCGSFCILLSPGEFLHPTVYQCHSNIYYSQFIRELMSSLNIIHPVNKFIIKNLREPKSEDINRKKIKKHPKKVDVKKVFK